MKEYTICEAISVGSMPVIGTDEQGNDMFDASATRSVTLMNRPGPSSAPYGGWKQVDSLHGIEVVIMPDGSTVDADEWPAIGYEDNFCYRVLTDGATVKIEEV